MPDPTMDVAFGIAQGMGVPPMPSWIDDVAQCVRAVEAVENNALRLLTEADYVAMQTLLGRVDEVFSRWSANAESAPGVGSVMDRKNILLRLWSGCISAGKMIALNTNDGPTSSATRARAFDGIDARAKACPIYRAGVAAAYDWKCGRRQGHEVSFDGVPTDSAVRARFSP